MFSLKKSKSLGNFNSKVEFLDPKLRIGIGCITISLSYPNTPEGGKSKHSSTTKEEQQDGLIQPLDGVIFSA